MNKILITGAAGFIGSHLVEFLLTDNVPLNRLRLALLENESTAFLPPKKFDIIRGDIRDTRFVKKAMEGVETVYHLAAITATTKEQQKYTLYKEINVDGTANLLRECANKKIQKFVLFSTVAVYGLPPWSGDILNWDESHPKTYSEIYGRSKYEAEKKVLEAYKKWGIPYAIVRPANVYGPRNTGQLYGLCKAIKNHQFVMVGSGKNKMHFVFVTDLVKGVRQMQLHPDTKADYILAGSEPTEFQDVVKYLSESMQISSPRIRIPRNILLAGSYVFDNLGKIIGVKSPLYPDRVKVLTMNYYYSIEKAIKGFGYSPKVSFHKGAMITGKWYLQTLLAKQ